MPEQVTSGTVFMPTKFGGTESRKYIKVEKTSRGKVVSTKYTIIEERELLGEDGVEEVVSEMRSLAEGLSNPRFYPVKEHLPYEEIPTYKMVVGGERAATDEEVELVLKAEADHEARLEAHRKAKREHMIAELRNEGYDVAPKA